MLQVCIFVPFLHSETPKPQNVPKSLSDKNDNIVPCAGLFKEVMAVRDRIYKV
jgi:hypothetical protein